jgi:hypothetical protein
MERASERSESLNALLHIDNEREIENESRIGYSLLQKVLHQEKCLLIQVLDVESDPSSTLFPMDRLNPALHSWNKLINGLFIQETEHFRQSKPGVAS